MRLRYQTAADPNLPHQVVFLTIGGGNGNPVAVTCNCRNRAHLPPMGESHDLTDARILYNDPDYHADPFDLARDGARW